MKRNPRFFWSLSFLGLFLLSTLTFAAGNATTPTEDELLDFDSLDKAEDGPATKTESPQPTPQTQVAQPQAPSVPAPTAPPGALPPPPPPQEIAEPSIPPPPALPPPQETVENPPSGEAPVAEDVSKADAQQEQRFARIYEKYNKSEIGDDEWSKIAGDRVSESYTLQNGDTLWDLSGKFFGNGFYWPKVWQLNDEITNPHNIKVGNTLKFSPGSVTSPPRLAVDKKDDEEPEIETLANAQAADDSGSSDVIIPPPRKSRPVLKKIPPSFPSWTAVAGHYDAQGFSTEILTRYKGHGQPQSALPSVISDELWASEGKVIEMEGGMTVASNYQNIIVELKTAPEPKSTYTIFSDNGVVEDLIDDIDVGYEMQTRAEIEITEPVEGVPDAYRAFVKFAVLPVRIGDSLRVGAQITRAQYDKAGPTSAVSARIVNGEWGKRAVFGMHNSVFLNRGEQDGLQVGVLLPVLRNVNLRNKDSRIRFDPKPIGHIKIVNVGKKVSTGVIVDESDAIIPGDETALIASAPPEAEQPTTTTEKTSESPDSEPQTSSEEIQPQPETAP